MAGHRTGDTLLCEPMMALFIDAYMRHPAFQSKLPDHTLSHWLAKSLAIRWHVKDWFCHQNWEWEATWEISQLNTASHKRNSLSYGKLGVSGVAMCVERWSKCIEETQYLKYVESFTTKGNATKWIIRCVSHNVSYNIWHVTSWSLHFRTVALDN